MDEEIFLTKSEKIAKNQFMMLWKEGFEKPCDVGHYKEIKTDDHPKWFDEDKFKRGQTYFQNNRFGILLSNWLGLIGILAEPQGLLILSSTGKSCTAKAAKKRYATIFKNLLCWYNVELVKGSNSWKSLNRVRRLHLLGSNFSIKKKQGAITQTEMSLTSFAFMGFALIKPHLLGIKCNSREDREGFVHFWAVMLYMIGVQDKFNICLNELELEMPLFKHMVSVLIEGISDFLPDISYESELFLTRRLVGIPGYQYNLNLDKEKLTKQILNKNELEFLRSKLLERLKSSIIVEFSNGSDLVNVKNEDIDLDPIYKFGLENENEWNKSLNDSKFKQLCTKDKIFVYLRCKEFTILQYKVGRLICDFAISVIIYFVNRYERKSNDTIV